ncbi:enoyl-CoA hydratase-related protein [Kangiella sp. TOML190]|uniref:enoyl-CoA hydratase-related protein n=1 Tax=Kangiella sp. TOML190 TaxID=2931351 RepID=UPI00203AAB8F|nr:enoyl-CoA hydratase-related protein [Kangiella sp. TOML190]
MSELVQGFVKNRVFHLELHRTDKKNALTGEMYQAMTKLLAKAELDPDVTVILFKGGHHSFCAGNDIADFLDESVLDPDGPIATFLHKLADLKKPMIAAVSGPAIGIGTTLLLHCDLVYATNEAVFSMPFVNLGVCAEAGSSYLLSRQIGQLRAAELLLTGDAFNAQRALEYGIINAVVASEDYWQFATEKAEKLAAKPQAALLASRELMKFDREKIHQVIDQEIAEFSRLLKTAEAKAIFKQFLSR